ncbi:cysteine hydrolase family protein [Pseudodesulfovibrio sp.]|uniref:cysteine hydrolase family protein n=1 Tax=unclassified Pseudodesulfovibrio TaxID=2661612 RepID=UPI003B00FAEB
MAKTALVVVDVQNIMFEEPGYDLYRKDEVLAVMKSLIDSARGAGVPVVYIQHTTEGIGSPFEKGTHNWQVRADIAPQPGDATSLKYSYDAFFNTELDAILKKLDAKKLVFCGLQTEVCMDTTVRSALAHGYESVLAADGHSTYDKPMASARTIIALHNDVLHRRFCTVLPAAEITFE